jgi:hypothetical protein
MKRGNASYPVLVHRLAVSLHASSPHSVTLVQLRFVSSAVVNSREDFHLQDRAHVLGAHNKARPEAGFVVRLGAFAACQPNGFGGGVSSVEGGRIGSRKLG